jgi:hypothetical protein
MPLEILWILYLTPFQSCSKFRCPQRDNVKRNLPGHTLLWEADFDVYGNARSAEISQYVPPPPSEGGVGLVPKRGCLLTLAYYTFPRWYEFGERRWNGILTGENRRTRRKTCPSATSPTTNPTWIDPGANPSLRGKRPATNHLSHDTAYSRYVSRICVLLTMLNNDNRYSGTGSIENGI